MDSSRFLTWRLAGARRRVARVGRIGRLALLGDAGDSVQLHSLAPLLPSAGPHAPRS